MFIRVSIVAVLALFVVACQSTGPIDREFVPIIPKKISSASYEAACNAAFDRTENLQVSDYAKSLGFGGDDIKRVFDYLAEPESSFIARFRRNQTFRIINNREIYHKLRRSKVDLSYKKDGLGFSGSAFNQDDFRTGTYRKIKRNGHNIYLICQVMNRGSGPFIESIVIQIREGFRVRSTSPEMQRFLKLLRGSTGTVRNIIFATGYQIPFDPPPASRGRRAMVLKKNFKGLEGLTKDVDSPHYDECLTKVDQLVSRQVAPWLSAWGLTAPDIDRMFAMLNSSNRDRKELLGEYKSFTAALSAKGTKATGEIFPFDLNLYSIKLSTKNTYEFSYVRSDADPRLTEFHQAVRRVGDGYINFACVVKGRGKRSYIDFIEMVRISDGKPRLLGEGFRLPVASHATGV